jgi:hypothetical protein
MKIKEKKTQLNAQKIIIIQFSSIYLLVKLTDQRPITKRARVEKKSTHIQTNDINNVIIIIIIIILIRGQKYIIFSTDSKEVFISC